MATHLDNELLRIVQKAQIWDILDYLSAYLITIMIGVLLAEVIFLIFGTVNDNMFWPIWSSIFVTGAILTFKRHVTEWKLRNARNDIVEFFERNPTYHLPK